jgi:IclR helix-turn-helix domain
VRRVDRLEQGAAGEDEPASNGTRGRTRASAGEPSGDAWEPGGETDAGGVESYAGTGRVSIELSAAQVDRVVRSAAEGGNISVLLSGLRDVREVLAREPRQLEDSRLSRSLLAGLLMLASFPADGSYLGNAEIARMLDMNPSTTHRYVSTLVAVGLLERDPATRRYRLV